MKILLSSIEEFSVIFFLCLEFLWNMWSEKLSFSDEKVDSRLDKIECPRRIMVDVNLMDSVDLTVSAGGSST